MKLALSCSEVYASPYCIMHSAPSQTLREPMSYKMKGELKEEGGDTSQTNKGEMGSETTRKYGNQVPSRKNQGTAGTKIS